MMQTVYVAGPMRGLPQCNFPAFDDAAAMLRASGWNVISPADHDRSVGFDPGPDDVDCTAMPGMYEGSMRWDLERIMNDCNALYMLADWEKSQGANTEHAVAKAIGLHIMYARRRDWRKYNYQPWGAGKK